MVGLAAVGRRLGAEHRLVQVGLHHPLQRQRPKDQAAHLEGPPLLVGRLLPVDLGQPLRLGTGAGQEAAEEFRARRAVLQQDMAQVATQHRVRAEDPGGALPERNHRALPGSTESRSRSCSPMRSSTYSSTAARRPCSEPKCHVTGAGERPAAAAIDRVEVAAKPCSANSSEAASRSRARPVGSLFATTRMVACVAVPDSDGPGTVSVAKLGTVQRGDAQCNRTDPVGAFGIGGAERSAMPAPTNAAASRRGSSAASLHLGCVQKGTAHSLPPRSGETRGVVQGSPPARRGLSRLGDTNAQFVPRSVGCTREGAPAEISSASSASVSRASSSEVMRTLTRTKEASRTKEA